jgi:hypothetical protein
VPSADSSSSKRMPASFSRVNASAAFVVDASAVSVLRCPHVCAVCMCACVCGYQRITQDGAARVTATAASLRTYPLLADAAPLWCRLQAVA